MGLKQQPKCKDKTCQFCTGKYCKILNQKPDGECPFKKERKSKAQKAKERYQRRKENNICVFCQKQDAYTLSGKVLCFECSQKRDKYLKDYYSKNAMEKKSKNKEKRAKCAQQGICTNCKKRKAEDGFKLCPVCRAKRRKKNKEAAERRGVVTNEMLPYLDVCHRCRKEPLMEGKKVCESCHEKICENLKKGREIARINRANEQFLYCFHFGRSLYGYGQK